MKSHTVTLTMDEMQRFLKILDIWYRGDLEKMVKDIRDWTRNMEDRKIASVLHTAEIGMHTTIDEVVGFIQDAVLGDDDGADPTDPS